MKRNVYIILFISIILQSCSFAKTINNKRACSKIEKQLKVVERYLLGEFEGKNVYPVSVAVSKCEQTTDIEAEYTGFFGDIGNPNPTQNDFDKWSKWYNSNQANLFYDRKSNQVVILNDSIE